MAARRMPQARYNPLPVQHAGPVRISFPSSEL